MRRIPLLAVVGLLNVSPVSAQVDWFPPQYAEGAANALVARLVEIGVEMSAGEQERIESARGLIRDLVARLDGWGIEGVLERTPDLVEIDLPAFEDRIIASIAVYGTCSLPLHPELVETNDELLYVALGEISVAVTSALLRHEFLAAGGTDEELTRHLNSERMNQLSYDIQVSEEKRNYVAAACGPMFEALFGS